MADETPPTSDRRRRTGEHAARLGGRSERVVRDVLQATLEELSRAGYAAFRVDEVAVRAGVNKTTIYRRWPAKADLVTAALRSMRPDDPPLPDTGSVQDDLLMLLRDTLAALAARPEKLVVSRIISAELDDPEVEAIARTLRAESRAPALEVIRRAIERGELPCSTDGALVVETIFATLHGRLFRCREPAPEQFLIDLVDLVILGAKSHTAPALSREATPHAGHRKSAVRLPPPAQPTNPGDLVTPTGIEPVLPA